MAALPVRRQIPLAFAFVLPILPLFLCFIVDCHFNVSFFLYTVYKEAVYFTSTQSVVTA